MTLFRFARARACFLLALSLVAGAFASGAAAQNVTTIAGGWVGDGNDAHAAALGFAGQVATDTSGNLYISDSSHHRIRKVTPAGVVSTVAGTGYSGSTGDGGQATQATLNEPEGIDLDAAGNIYVSESRGNRIRKISTSGVISTVAGDGSSAILNAPGLLAVNADGSTIYVSETSAHRVRKVSGGVVTTFAGNGTGAFAGDGGPATSASLWYPYGIFIRPNGNVLIADSNNDRIREVDTGGNISSFATLSQPFDIAYSPAGEFYVVGFYGVYRQSNWDFSWGYFAGGEGVPQAGNGFSGDGDFAINAVFNDPYSLAIAPDGRVLINDYLNGRIRVVEPVHQIISTFVGPGTSGDGGAATSALVAAPTGMAYDSAGNLYVSERFQNRIRKITPAGIISTYAGNGIPAFAGDGGQAINASFNQPRGIWMDASNNLYVADAYNHRVRMIAANGVISTVAGGAPLGSPRGDNGPPTNALLSYPVAVAKNAAGSLFISENGAVRVVPDHGFIQTFAGLGSAYADNVPASGGSKVGRPGQLAFDGGGNLYFPDSSAHAVRKVTMATGIITTVAGALGVPGTSGDGGAATAALLQSPYSLQVDANGDFAVSDTSRRLRKVTAGVIQTIGGSGIAGYNGDGPATATHIDSMAAIVRDSAGNYLVTDNGNGLVRRIGSASVAPSLSIADVTIAEGNSGTRTATFTVSLSAAASGAVTYNIATANGTATAGSDYVASSLTGQSIAAGQTSKTFSVTINGDTMAESDETFTVGVSSVIGASVADGSALGTIANDDAGPTPNMWVSDMSITEGNSGTKTLDYVVHLSAPSSNTVSFDVATQNNSAVAGSDYVAVSQTGVTIAAGLTSKTVSVTINGDTTVEPDEAFIFNIRNAVGANITVGSVWGNIVNDDTAGGGGPPPNMWVSDMSITEGNSGTKTLNYVVNLSAASSSTITFDAATQNNSAIAGSDYVAVSQTGVTIAAGQTSKVISVTINGDTTVEPDEAFIFNIRNAVGANITVGSVWGNIVNDDTAGGGGPPPNMWVSDMSVTEGNSGTKTLNYVVNLSAASSSAITFDAATTNNTAIAGSDYVAVALTGVTIAAGQTSKVISVTINGDTAVEPDEAFIFNISNANGAYITVGSVWGNILNDDTGGGGPVGVSIGDVTVTEGNSGTKLATFTVSIPAPQSTVVQFDIATGNGTATAGSDYVAKSALHQRIAIGGTSKTFTVTINGDTTPEADETFTVSLSNVNGPVADGVAVGTISNDDAGLVSVARLDSGGLVDDVDDGNGQVQLSLGEYATLLADTTSKLCRRTGAATVVAVDGVENPAVLRDLADSANALCPGQPRYQAVMAAKDATGFLVQAPAASDGRGATVLTAPVHDTKAGATALQVQAPGQGGALTVLVPDALPANPAQRSAQLRALGTKVQAALGADKDERVVLIGAVTVPGLLDLTARSWAQVPAGGQRQPLPGERVLVSARVLQEFGGARIEFPARKPGEAPAQVLQLRR